MSDNNDMEIELNGKIVVLGLGMTGLSVVRYLAKKDCHAVVLDSRLQPAGEKELKEKYADIKYSFGRFDQNKLATAKQLIVSPGISVKSAEIQYAKDQGVDIIGDIELFAQNVQAPVIAITGSNGKSTVTTLVGEILEASGLKVAVGGNIGVPALDLLDQGFDVFVLELSSFQLETLYSLKPVAAVVLNVSEDHMDRYDSFDSYIAAKQSIYINAEHCVINRDDEIVSNMQADQNVLGFGLEKAQENDFALRRIDGQKWICKGKTPLINTAELLIGGSHNVANVMAALALVESLDLEQGKVLGAIKNFSGLPHRMQRIALKNGICWYNDSKATNVGAANAAIAGLTGKVVLIAGGESKEADLAPLKKPVQQHVKLMILIGRDALKIEQVCKGVTNIIHASCMYEAVVKANEAALPGDNVLLSPACASFDMFDNYQHRGEVYNAAVKAVLA